MYDIIEQIIGYISGSGTYNITTYIVQTCCALIIVFTVVMIDLLFKLLFGLINKIT